MRQQNIAADKARVFGRNVGDDAEANAIENGFLLVDVDALTSTLSHLKALILFAINLKLHTTAFAFLKALLLFLLGFYHSSGFIRFCLNSAQIQFFYAALSCAPAWRLQRYKSLVARA